MAEAPVNSKGKKGIVLALLLLTLAGVSVVYHLLTRDRISTDDAYIEGRMYAISPRVAGYVSAVFVEDNQRVRKGQPLLALDAADFEVALAEAKAVLVSLQLDVPLTKDQTAFRVSSAQADIQTLDQNLEKARNETQAAEQELSRAEKQHQLAKLELARMQRLIKDRVVSQSAFDQASTLAATGNASALAAAAKLEAARKQRDSLVSDMNRLVAQVGLAATGVDHAKIKSALVAVQETRVRQAELNLEYATVLAPAEGYVTKKAVELGQMLTRGQPVMVLVSLSPKDIWVTANFKETDLTDVRPGQPVRIKVDTYPGAIYSGRVESLMAGAGAAFSLFPPENASGNYVKVVQRIPVKIALEGYDPAKQPLLRLGMSVVPTIFVAADAK